VFAFWIGIYPKPLFNLLDKPVEQIVMRYDPSYYAPKTASAAPIETMPVKPAETPGAQEETK